MGWNNPVAGRVDQKNHRFRLGQRFMFVRFPASAKALEWIAFMLVTAYWITDTCPQGPPMAGLRPCR